MSVEQYNSINEALVGGIKLAVKFVTNNISRSLLSVAKLIMHINFRTTKSLYFVACDFFA